MNASSARRRFEDLERALERLDEALAVPADAPLAVDGTIQRFEFAFELCWKAIKALLQLENPAGDFATPRATIRAAYGAGWIKNEAAWLDLLDMRNATSHTYREALAQEVYGRIRVRAPMLKRAAAELRERLP
ncbi:MAG TPA: nucleotidyltransferase substrate binding protein [Rhizomicrobium sp.]|nr:nucleotidyltransferase substrate binding protein [Rhizomicrobium sp.]